VFCARCDRPITAGTSDVITNPGATAGGSEIRVCRGWCPVPPRQTAPEADVILTASLDPRSRPRRRPRR
jgi:hypothetical protein